jgi:enediyne biosynthesis protein E4
MKQILFAFLLSLTCIACKKEKTLFVALDSAQTGIDFSNTITENDTLNILTTEFVYNGGGVAIGDLNGDGLQDVFFTGNQVDNRMYLNKGDLKFEDITAFAGVQKNEGQWSSGINFLDINADGKTDIYVCNTFLNNPRLRQNFLYINQGNTEGGKPKFQNMAAEYGIADTTHSSNAQFFDYDNDGDLDLFIAVNYMDTPYPNQYFKKLTDGSSPNRDKLFRNDWNAALNHPVFTDISFQAGIKFEGYSHSSLITDFNQDGWLDIYVANDYITNDLIYINQKNGTFKNEVAQIFKHQAASAMGSDVADINNDGQLDFFTTEMLPYHNKRKKLFLNGNNYNGYINNEAYGYEYQYSRNILQLNRGINPETGLPVFSDVAFMGDVQETEWSWTPLMADFDNDGHRDLFVTNGFPRDVTDHDFGAFRGGVSNLMANMDLQSLIPQIKVPKFMFKNEGNLHFKDVSQAWGVQLSSFTNGAATADLDNDGDLDLITNNINDKAFVFKNTWNEAPTKTRFCRIKLVGDAKNIDAYGATVTAYFAENQQVAQVTSARGYISSSENIIHFGMGDIEKMDSVKVVWQGGKTGTYKDIKTGEVNVLKYNSSIPPQYFATSNTSFFNAINPSALGLAYMHRDSDYIDFNIQRTLPHKFSQYGPSLAVGDVNGDNLDDIYVGAAAKMDGTWFIQTKDGRFSTKSAAYKTDIEKKEEELGTLLFDADNDGDNDLYIVRGSNQYEVNSPLYQDVLCVNDGKGKFTIAPNALPVEMACGQAVKAADYDGDGDWDLFVGGRVLPKSYPKTDRSFILRNDSKEKDKPIFTDITAQICPELTLLGMITDAVWSDFNNDNQPDLILAGEWMPITFLQNDKGVFKNITAQTGIGDNVGWWTSLCAADFDNDGDTDYIGGNFGQNTYFKCNSQYPLSIYAKDFDNNGLYDPFISCYWQDTVGKRQEYFYHTRDDMVKQLVLIRRKFQTYGAFGAATVPEVFTKEELHGAQILKANWLYSSFIENMGNGQFKMSILPMPAQLAPIYGMLPYDIDHDGLLDIMMVGNDYGMELLQGRADAFNGLILKNLGKNNFASVELNQSHFYVPNDARALTRVLIGGKKEVILASQNKGALKLFAPQYSYPNYVFLDKNNTKAEIVLTNGQRRLHELQLGSSFLSQHPLSIGLDKNVKEVWMKGRDGNVNRKQLMQ